MKSIGIVRKIDNLGRIVIPKEIRDTQRWGVETPMEMYMDGNALVIRKHETCCAICEGDVGLDGLAVLINGKMVCSQCCEKINGR